MKKIFIAIVCLFPVLGMAQTNSSLPLLLNNYYDIKNALVNSDGNIASEKATVFLKTINSIDTKTLPSAEQKLFVSLKEKLVFDAEHIAGTKDVEHQREHFSSFSDNIYKLAKNTKFSSPVYQMYCPMKKVYWLSAEKEIRNPYYGKKMLTCGKITATH